MQSSIINDKSEGLTNIVSEKREKLENSWCRTKIFMTFNRFEKGMNKKENLREFYTTNDAQPNNALCDSLQHISMSQEEEKKNFFVPSTLGILTAKISK
jgi:hypothetical protein